MTRGRFFESFRYLRGRIHDIGDIVEISHEVDTSHGRDRVGLRLASADYFYVKVFLASCSSER